MKTEFFSLDLKECVSPPYSYFSNLIFKKNVLKGLVLVFRMETSPVRKFEKKVGKNVKKKKTGYKTKSEEKVQKRKIGHKICMTLIGLRYFVVFNYFLICRV